MVAASNGPDRRPETSAAARSSSCSKDLFGHEPVAGRRIELVHAGCNRTPGTAHRRKWFDRLIVLGRLFRDHPGRRSVVIVGPAGHRHLVYVAVHRARALVQPQKHDRLTATLSRSCFSAPRLTTLTRTRDVAHEACGCAASICPAR